MKLLPLLSGSLLLVATAPLPAQTLFFQAGAVELADVTISGTNVERKVKRPDGSETTQAIPVSNVVRVDFPEPDSPAMPSVLPAPIESVRFLTASKAP